jgi:hypothetical protein
LSKVNLSSSWPKVEGLSEDNVVVMHGVAGNIGEEEIIRFIQFKTGVKTRVVVVRDPERIPGTIYQMVAVEFPCRPLGGVGVVFGLTGQQIWDKGPVLSITQWDKAYHPRLFTALRELREFRRGREGYNPGYPCYDERDCVDRNEGYRSETVMEEEWKGQVKKPDLDMDEVGLKDNRAGDFGTRYGIDGFTGDWFNKLSSEGQRLRHEVERALDRSAGLEELHAYDNGLPFSDEPVGGWSHVVYDIARETCQVWCYIHETVYECDWDEFLGRSLFALPNGCTPSLYKVVNWPFVGQWYGEACLSSAGQGEKRIRVQCISTV